MLWFYQKHVPLATNAMQSSKDANSVERVESGWCIGPHYTLQSGRENASPTHAFQNCVQIDRVSVWIYLWSSQNGCRPGQRGNKEWFWESVECVLVYIYMEHITQIKRMEAPGSSVDFRLFLRHCANGQCVYYTLSKNVPKDVGAVNHAEIYGDLCVCCHSRVLRRLWRYDDVCDVAVQHWAR